MSEQPDQQPLRGHALRRAGLGQSELAALVQAAFGEAQVYAFDYDLGRLGAIKGPVTPALLPLGGLAGHVFNEDAELRWRLRDGVVDVLGLAESPAAVARLAAAQLRLIRSYAAVVVPPRAAFLLGRGMVEGREDDLRLSYVEYRGAGSVPQLTRYCRVGTIKELTV